MLYAMIEMIQAGAKGQVRLVEPLLETYLLFIKPYAPNYPAIQLCG